MSSKRLFQRNGVRYGDIVLSLPVPKASAKGVYCSHVLEHIDRTSIVTALRNAFDMLQPAGGSGSGLRARSYLDANVGSDPVAADHFMRI